MPSSVWIGTPSCPMCSLRVEMRKRHIHSRQCQQWAFNLLLKTHLLFFFSSRPKRNCLHQIWMLKSLILWVWLPFGFYSFNLLFLVCVAGECGCVDELPGGSHTPGKSGPTEHQAGPHSRRLRRRRRRKELLPSNHLWYACYQLHISKWLFSSSCNISSLTFFSCLGLLFVSFFFFFLSIPLIIVDKTTSTHYFVSF